MLLLEFWDPHNGFMFARTRACSEYQDNPLRTTPWNPACDPKIMFRQRNDLKRTHIYLHLTGQPNRNTKGTRQTTWTIRKLRWGWVFLERTQILIGIQFTTHFIKKFVVETKRFVGSFVNVILTRQTCGQRSSRAAESKRRALGNNSERICYMLQLSKCKGIEI
jgi:hypothetical protein